MHTRRVAPRLLAVAFGLWGIALTAGLLTDSWPATLFERGGSKSTAAPPQLAAGGGPGDPGGAETPATGGQLDGPAMLAMTPRYEVCRDAGHGARMTMLELGESRLLSVHCGTRVLWLSLVTGEGGNASPRLEASLELPSRTAQAPQVRGVALTTTAADLDGDGRPDLIVPHLQLDASGAPLEGGVAWLPRPLGAGLGAPRQLIGGHPLVTIHGRFDGKSTAVGLLGVGNRRIVGEHELWLLSAQPAPVRSVKLDVDDATAAVAIDLDLDGRDDVVMGGVRRSAAWWLAASETTIHGHTLGPVRETVAGDLSGDGHPDALLVGDGLWILQASRAGAFSPTAIESTQCKGAACMRDVHLTDLDADGKLDIIGYVHPAVRWLRNRGGSRFESRPLARIEGDAMSILQALVTDANLDGLPDLLLLGHVKGSPGDVELAIVHDVRTRDVIRLGGDPLPTPIAPLAPRYTLR